MTRMQRPKVCDLMRTPRAQKKGHKPFIEATGPLTSKCAAEHNGQRRADVNELEWIAAIRSFGYRLEPRYIFRAGRLDQ